MMGYIPPDQADTPWEQTPPRTRQTPPQEQIPPNQADTAREQTPPTRQTPPQEQTPPPRPGRHPPGADPPPRADPQTRQTPPGKQTPAYGPTSGWLRILLECILVIPEFKNSSLLARGVRKLSCCRYDHTQTVSKWLKNLKIFQTILTLQIVTAEYTERWRWKLRMIT